MLQYPPGSLLAMQDLLLQGKYHITADMRKPKQKAKKGDDLRTALGQYQHFNPANVFGICLQICRERPGDLR